MSFIFFYLPLSSFTSSSYSQPVQPCTRWLATVDSLTQQVVVQWSPSATPSTRGYHLCTGSPCLSLDTVYGRADTSYVAASLSPLEAHRFRLHAFDSAGNVSALTPFFGPMVLRAEVAECDSVAQVEWTSYVGMSGGVRRYSLMARFGQGAARAVYTADSLGPLRFALPIPTSATGVELWVVAEGRSGRSLSNAIRVRRATADTATRLVIADAVYDSASRCVRLALDLDTAFHASAYRLLASSRGSAFAPLALVADTAYADCAVNPYDSLRCYMVEVADACGLNPRRSDMRCAVIPTPPEPAFEAPNVLLLSDPANARFLPRVQGLAGDLYELSVYNRMGLLVFHTTSPAEGWSPSPSGTPQGVYAYVLRVRYINNQVKTHVGTITVLK